MNNFKPQILLLLTLLFTFSCNIEPYEGDVTNESATADDTGTYWPMAPNNSWSYTQSVTGFADEASTMEISSIEEYQGEPSYKFTNFFGNLQGTDGTNVDNVSLDYYTRNNNGDYRIFIGEMTAEFSGLFKITQSTYDYIILKDYEEIGYKWDYDFDVSTSYEALISTGGTQLPDIVTNYQMAFEILEKNTSIQVDGNTYSDVIAVKFDQEVSLTDTTLGGTSSKASYIYYFAKNIGIVKIEGTILDGDDNILSEVEQILTDYLIN